MAAANAPMAPVDEPISIDKELQKLKTELEKHAKESKSANLPTIKKLHNRIKSFELDVEDLSAEVIDAETRFNKVVAPMASLPGMSHYVSKAQMLVRLKRVTHKVAAFEQPLLFRQAVDIINTLAEPPLESKNLEGSSEDLREFVALLQPAAPPYNKLSQMLLMGILDVVAVTGNSDGLALEFATSLTNHYADFLKTNNHKAFSAALTKMVLPQTTYGVTCYQLQTLALQISALYKLKHNYIEAESREEKEFALLGRQAYIACAVTASTLFFHKPAVQVKSLLDYTNGFADVVADPSLKNMEALRKTREQTPACSKLKILGGIALGFLGLGLAMGAGPLLMAALSALSIKTFGGALFVVAGGLVVSSMASISVWHKGADIVKQEVEKSLVEGKFNANVPRLKHVVVLFAAKITPAVPAASAPPPRSGPRTG